jgi:hypothetical protein
MKFVSTFRLSTAVFWVVSPCSSLDFGLEDVVNVFLKILEFTCKNVRCRNTEHHNMNSYSAFSCQAVSLVFNRNLDRRVYCNAHR